MDPSQAYQIALQNWPVIVSGAGVLHSISRWGIRYIADHYRHDPPEVLEEAARNASDFTNRNSDKVRASLDAGFITEAQVQSALKNPGFVKILQSAVLSASETSSSLYHEQLARLVSERLYASSESTVAITLRMAIERIRDLTDKQLQLLGLIFVAMKVLPPFEFSGDAQSDLKAYAELCDVELKPFSDVRISELDLAHIESLNLVHITGIGGGLGIHFGTDVAQSPMRARLGSLQGTLISSDPPAVLNRLNSLVVSNVREGKTGLEAVQLLSIGFVIGYSVYAQFRDVKFELDDWQDRAT